MDMRGRLRADSGDGLLPVAGSKGGKARLVSSPVSGCILTRIHQRTTISKERSSEGVLHS